MKSPDLDAELYYLWELYIDVKKGNKSVSWAGIESYQNVTGSILSPWEASLMIDIDMVRRKHG